MKNPAAGAYRLCTQEVTVYHRNENDTYTTTYHTKSFFDSHRTQAIEKTGSQDVSGYLVVIVGNPDIQPGDKILLGHGKRMRTREEWAALIPATTKNLVIARTIDYKTWQGEVVHVEIGG